MSSANEDKSQFMVASSIGRRVFDFTLSLACLLALSPFMLVIAILIVLESGRPILFSQLRLGHRGRPFVMYKFRKFHSDCSANGLQLTLKWDSRLTKVGRFIVSTKLDELPQLWNVLIGDMSIIGPRPESLAYADCFKGGFERVLEHKPGIFGPSQARFRNENALYPKNGDLNEFYRTSLFPTKTNIDLSYYPHRTLASDIGWLFQSVIATLGLNTQTSLLIGTEGETELRSVTDKAQCASLPETSLGPGKTKACEPRESWPPDSETIE